MLQLANPTTISDPVIIVSMLSYNFLKGIQDPFINIVQLLYHVKDYSVQVIFWDISTYLCELFKKKKKNPIPFIWRRRWLKWENQMAKCSSQSRCNQSQSINDKSANHLRVKVQTQTAATESLTRMLSAPSNHSCHSKLMYIQIHFTFQTAWTVSECSNQ